MNILHQFARRPLPPRLFHRATGENPLLLAYDNFFDQTTITRGTASEYFAHDHNGYISGQSRLQPSPAQHDVVLATMAYAPGPLGNFYHAQTNLVDQGSRSAADAGLCRYTTLTNQAQECNSAVDIGFHYVPVERVMAIPKSTVTVTVLDEDPSYPASHTLDGSIYAPGWWYWKGSGNPGWLRFDLGGTTALRRFDYQPPEWFEGLSLDYELYVTDSASTNRAAWGAPVAEGTWHWPHGTGTKRLELAGSGRYVILRCLDGVAGYAAANEVWLYRAEANGSFLVAADTEPDNIPDYLERCCPALDVSPAVGLTVTIEDAADPECGGTNSQVQDKEVSVALCVPDGMMDDLDVAVTGTVETHDPEFDKVYLNGVLLFQSTQTQGQGCGMETKSGVASVTVTPCDGALRLRYWTVDRRFHQGAHARITTVTITATNAFPGMCVPSASHECE